MAQSLLIELFEKLRQFLKIKLDQTAHSLFKFEARGKHFPILIQTRRTMPVHIFHLSSLLCSYLRLSGFETLETQRLVKISTSKLQVDRMETFQLKVAAFSN